MNLVKSVQKLMWCGAIAPILLFVSPLISPIISPLVLTARAEDAAVAADKKPKASAASHAPKSTAKKINLEVQLPPSLSSQSSQSGIGADETRDFARAQNLLTQGKEAEALVSWSDFLRRYPTSSLADDAQLGLGETYFRQRKFEEAATEFQKVFRYGISQSENVPEAGLRLGECWFQLKQLNKARIEWEAIRRRYPSSQAAARAQVLLAGIP